MKPRRASTPRQPPGGRAEGRGAFLSRSERALRPEPSRAAGVGKPHAATPPTPASHATAPAEVRIVGGRWKRSRLPVADKPGLRPTPDRVRETLFNWLGQDLAGWRVLDAFAGSGALGFEAASRGAAEVLLVEADAGLAASLEVSRQRLLAADAGAVPGGGAGPGANPRGEARTGPDAWPDAGPGGDAVRVDLRVQRGDALALMATLAAGPRRFDLVLLDPPFVAGAAGLFEQALRAALGVLAADGLVYLEADRAFDAASLAALGYVLWRQARAGRVQVHLLRRAAPAEAAMPATPVGE